MQASRRAFFGFRRKRRDDPMRPPWAVAEVNFLERCTRCAACVNICPLHLLIKGSGGFPEADFTTGHAAEGCTFCGKCLSACRDGALCAVDGQAIWTLHAVFGEACLAARNVVCRTCGEACEARAISFPPCLGGISQPQLSADACTGCGACLADCPTQAISMLPDASRSIATQGAV